MESDVNCNTAPLKEER